MEIKIRENWQGGWYSPRVHHTPISYERDPSAIVSEMNACKRESLPDWNSLTVPSISPFAIYPQLAFSSDVSRFHYCVGAWFVPPRSGSRACVGYSLLRWDIGDRLELTSLSTHCQYQQNLQQTPGLEGSWHAVGNFYRSFLGALQQWNVAATGENSLIFGLRLSSDRLFLSFTYSLSTDIHGPVLLQKTKTKAIENRHQLRKRTKEDIVLLASIKI